MNMKKIYKQVAKQYGVSVEEVKREMQKAIEATYAKPNFYAECVKRKNEIPTPEELNTSNQQIPVYMKERIKFNCEV